jgi:uncharacterized protein (DUF302 family)
MQMKSADKALEVSVLVGNAVIARGLFEYSGAAGLGAPVRVCVSQRDGEETRIDLDLPSAFFSKFPEMQPSSVPALLDAKIVRVRCEIRNDEL